jgi:hypothetical protein
VTWEDALILEATPGDDLRPFLDRLFDHAHAHWPLLHTGALTLQSVQVKELVAGDGRLLVQTNPARRRSVHAATDPASIAARPCFLCPRSFPPGECGIAWGDLALLPNPYPIVPRHLTIPSRRHVLQALPGRSHDLVRLAQGLGEEMVVFYNGPRGGASAPDHFHFQACADELPAFELLPPEPTTAALAVDSFGRRFVALFDNDAACLAVRIEAALAAWGRVQAATDGGEPMANVLVRWQRTHGTALFFPRRAHRPSVFHAEGDGRIAVSPAALEMAGILVVTDGDSYERLDARASRAVFEEVSPTPQQLAALMEQIQ